MMTSKYKVYIGSDYRGYQMKAKIIEQLKGRHDFIEIFDKGCDSEESNSYNDYAIAVAREVKKDKNNFGILICDSGHGMTIQANRFRGIRACSCHDAESAKLAREHENANILCLASDFVKSEELPHILYTFFHTEYPGLPRRDARIRRLDEEEYD